MSSTETISHLKTSALSLQDSGGLSASSSLLQFGCGQSWFLGDCLLCTGGGFGARFLGRNLLDGLAILADLLDSGFRSFFGYDLLFTGLLGWSFLVSCLGSLWRCCFGSRGLLLSWLGSFRGGLSCGWLAISSWALLCLLGLSGWFLGGAGGSWFFLSSGLSSRSFLLCSCRSRRSWFFVLFIGRIR